MADSGEQFAVLYDSFQPNTTQLAIASTNNNVVSPSIELKWAQTASFQILSDGGAKVNWTYQVTNLTSMPTAYGRTILGATARDDTYTSAQWSTVSTGSLAAGASQQGTIQTIGTSVHRLGRLLLNWDSSNTAGTSAKLLIVVRTMGVS